MPAPKIIGPIRSTYTRAVCMVCEEKGLEYRLTETMLHSADLRAIHPFDKMPVLRHGDVELFESKAIATYLDRSFPAPFVFPTDARLAGLTEQWVSLVNTVIDRTLIRTYLYAYIAPRAGDGKPDGEAIAAAAKHLAAHYERPAGRPSFARTAPPAGPPRRAETGSAS